MSVRIDHEQVRDAQSRRLAQALEGLERGAFLAERREPRVHELSRTARRVLERLFYVAALLRRQQPEQALPARGAYVRDDDRQPDEVSRREHRARMIVVHVIERARGDVGAHAAQHRERLGASTRASRRRVFRRDLVEHCGSVAGMAPQERGSQIGKRGAHGGGPAGCSGDGTRVTFATCMTATTPSAHSSANAGAT